MTDIKKKKRQYKNKTPGQERDYETLSARRMFQAYEDAPTNSTGPAIANWDPPLGKQTKVVYKRKRRELDMETFNVNKVDGRTRSYKETVRRIKERQEKLKDGNGAEVKEPVLKPNPFGHPVAEIHSSKEGPAQRAQKDAAIAAWKKAGGQVKKIKPSLKGMPKSRKAIVKARKEEVEMNKKYFDTRSDSLEAAAYQSVNAEVPVNPNSLHPTLHLPKKYLATKEGSLERAVEEAMTEKAGVGAATAGPKPGYKLPRQLKNPKKEKMVGTKSGTKVVDRKDPKYKGAPEHESVEIGEGEWADEKRKERESSARLLKIHNEREKRYQAQQAKQKQTREQAVDVINAIQFGKAFKVVDENEIPSAELKEKEVAENGDDRRTVDAIRAYDKSKDASRDADWDTVHGKIKQGKKEKKYAKKERGEIHKDDPHWKSRAYHTGMHGEETEMSPMIQATMEKIHFMRDDKLSYKERQKLPKGDFALPGKGSGPEGKQGGSYPIPDESHARNALARVSQHGSEAEKAKVRRAVASKFPNIKIGESKETEAGERDVGTDAYANYTKGLTPGQTPDSDVTNKDAKKANSESKKNSDEKERQATRIDDEYIAHLESLDEAALEIELETLSQNELLELLGSGLVKKAAGAITKRFSAQGRLAAAKKKATKIQQKTDIAKTKTSNIAAKAKLKDAKAKLKAAKGPGVVSKVAKKVGGVAKKAIGAGKPAGGNTDTRNAPGRLAAEYDPESLIGQAMDELSKKTLGSYVKKASTSKSDAAMALQRSTSKPGGQTRGDVNKHVGKMIKRDKGIGKAVDKLTK